MESLKHLEVWLVTGFLAASSSAAGQVRDREPIARDGSDRPKVAIIQYESGRTLVAREVDGELQVVEVSGRPADIIARHLDASAGQPVSNGPGNQQGAAPRQDDEVFFNPGWYYDRAVINVTPPEDASRVGRATERYKQNAAELQAQVRDRRLEQGTRGLTNSAGQAYPLTAGEALEDDRLARVQGGLISSDPYTTFYSLGGGLEYYRQRELAARKELTLLTFDVLLEEGMAFFEAGRYGEAARSFQAATQKDHGDAGSRLFAAQSLMAVGLYSEALDHVRRAVELAPQLLHRPLNHRGQYERPEDFDRQLRALGEHVARHPADADAALLLAYEQLYSGTPAQAAEPMRRVKDLSGRDGFAKKLYEAARPMLGER